MLIRNTVNRYGVVAIVLHWLMALLIIGLLVMGLYMVQLPIGLSKLKLYGWHKEFGFLVFLLVLVRLGWRLKNVTPSLANLMLLERIAARAVHWAFYFCMFALPISGWLITSAAGLPISFFGLFVIPNLITPNEEHRVLYQEIHKWLAYGVIALITMHTAAALKHHFINKDDILRRIIS